jgi:hypothetical protein
MGNKTRYLVIALSVFVVGFLFSFSEPGHAVAQGMKPLLVEVTNLPLSITGAVNVENLPLDEASNSLRTISLVDGLRDGNGTISFEGGPWERSLAIPEGVAVTDVVIERVIVSDDDECDIWFYELAGGAIGPMIVLRPSVANPIAELHLKSGLLSTGGREVGLFLNSSCRVRVLWTGYEY